tara:strand:+ start:998 stop:1276 length:279 start_codon:yes stop_codon:yes gene_type:complete
MKNALLGFLMATCMFLMIGATNEEPNVEERQIVVECEASENGRYQGFGDGAGYRYMIDTQTGELYHIPAKISKDKKNRVWNRVSAESNFIEE